MAMHAKALNGKECAAEWPRKCAVAEWPKKMRGGGMKKMMGGGMAKTATSVCAAV